jgi:uncharacterized protein YraI
MKYGTLQITAPGAAARSYPIDKETVNIGRAQDNDLIIEDISMSRRHARLSIAAGQVYIEDLGSANGVFVDNRRLQPQVQTAITETTSLRLGDVQVRFTPPPPPPPARGGIDSTFIAEAEAVQPSTAGPSTMVAPGASGPLVNVSLVGPAQAVMPGNLVTASLTVQNRGTVVDELLLRLSGLPGEWVRLSKDRIPLLPNDQETITISFQPPRRPEALARDHPFQIAVYSREHGKGSNVTGVLKVLPYRDFGLSLEPVRSQKDFSVQLENRGNAPVSYQLSGNDDEHSLRYNFQPPSLTLAPAQKAAVPLEVAPKEKPRIGSRETRAFSVTATPVERDAAPATTNGQLVIRPPVPVWLIPLLLLLMLCGCITAAYAYTQVCPTIGRNLPLCPAGSKPVIVAFAASPEEVSEKGGLTIIGWDVKNAETIELLAPALNLTANVEPSGLREFNLDQTTTFSLRARNFAGTVEESVIVVVKGSPPVIQSFMADPGAIIAGQAKEVVLSWTVVNASAVSIEGVPGQNFPPTGSVQVPAPAQTRSYVLVATNEISTVRQELSITVASAGCVVSNVPETETLNIRTGPDMGFPIVAELSNGTAVEPLGRNENATWLKVRSSNNEGWVSAAFVTCGIEIPTIPTVAPEQLPTVPPTNTPQPTDTPAPTATVTNTPPPTPTQTPVLSSGLLTYRVVVDGKTTIYLQRSNGGPTALVSGKDDAMVMDYTTGSGGLFAIWVLEGGAHTMYIVRQDGSLVKGSITADWQTITEADWSMNGTRLVVEGVQNSKPKYYFFDAAGNLLTSPVYVTPTPGGFILPVVPVQPIITAIIPRP